MLVALVSSGGCDASSAYRVEVSVEGAPVPLNSQITGRLGDTVRFVAAVYFQPSLPFEGDEQKRSSSDTSPHLFKWVSSDSSVIRIVAPGSVWMRAVGTATLTVETGSAKSSHVIRVYAP